MKTISECQVGWFPFPTACLKSAGAGTCGDLDAHAEKAVFHSVDEFTNKIVAFAKKSDYGKTQFAHDRNIQRF